MNKRIVIINSITSVSQVIISGVCYFLLYKLILLKLGAEQLGIWALVLASTSVAGVCNFGISDSVVKFVAKYRARDDEDKICSIIQTSAILLSVFIGFALILFYWLMRPMLSLVVPAASIGLAMSIVPYALLSLWFTLVATIFLSGLDGYQRIYVKNSIMAFCIVFYLAASYVLLPVYGLKGLAFAQLGQSVMLFVVSWFMLRQQIPALPPVPHRWNLGVLKEIIGYGLNLQVISVCRFVYDPITKALLTKFGGLGMVGIYEMASRLIVQSRALIVSVNKVLVPTIADFHERNPDLVEKIYKSSFNLVFYFSVPLFLLLMALGPFISHLWIGYYDRYFVIFFNLLSIGWLLNTLSGPAYFATLGIGKLKWNTISHITIAVLNLILGFTLGSIFGGIAVVVGWVTALVIGSSINFVMYHFKNKISFDTVFSGYNIRQGIFSVCGLSVSLIFYYAYCTRLGPLIVLVNLFLLMLLVVLVPLWTHPIRKRFIQLIANELLNKDIV